MQVYVINKRGQTLMPCSPAKARHLLKDGKAKVIKCTPFTIQLLNGSSGYKQTTILGVDAGSKTIGVRKANQAAKYVKDFRLFDKVCYQGQECFVWGRRTSGSILLRLLNGAKVKDGVGYKHLHLLERSSNYLITCWAASSPCVRARRPMQASNRRYAAALGES